MPEIDVQTVAGAAPAATLHPLATLGVQLIDAVIQRLNGPAPGEPREGKSSLDSRREWVRLKRMCRLLSRRNEFLASALGACRCWGRSADCPHCGGRGRPGSFNVDESAFNEVVLPLIRAQPECFARYLTDETKGSSEQPT